jgi:hypothetical protein
MSYDGISDPGEFDLLTEEQLKNRD